MTTRRRSLATLAALVSGVALISAQPGDIAGRIRAEGQQRSRALALFRTLTDDIGARLTGSPAHMRAARWALDRFAEWGLANPHLEPYEFGRGWQLEQLSVAMTEPRYVPLVAYADAWSPSTSSVLSGRAVYVGDKTAPQIEAMAGQLRGAIVLTHLPQAEFVARDRPQPGLDDRPVPTGNPALPQPRSTTPAAELMPLLKRAGAAVALRPSAYRDGTVGVTGNRATAPDSVPSIVVAGEQYNVMARLAAEGKPVSLRVELRARYLEEDRNSYNVVAEIPGTDPALRDQVVLVGAHLDSWHTGTGADRQRGRRRRRHGSDAHPPHARRRPAAHHPRGALERRRAGAARRPRLRRAALQHAGGAGSTRRLPERRSRKRQNARLLHGREQGSQGHLRSLARAAEGPRARRGTSSKASAPRITCRSTRPDCPVSTSSRTSARTTSVCGTPTPTIPSA